MTTDSSVVYEGFVLQLISTRFESESFECSDLSVIPADKKCDHISDCPSGDDEHECDNYDIELSSEAWKNLTYQLAYSDHTVDATWRITNTRGLSGYAVQVRMIQLGKMSSLVIGLGLDDSLTETRAVVLSPYSPLLELLFESEALWVHLHSYESTDAAFELELRPAHIVGGPLLCSEGRVNISSNAICDGEKQCIDGNDERNCNHPILPEECGLRPALDVHRVTHGSEVTILGEAPWQVALYANGFRFICGASIIANDWILTAAHCVEDFYQYSPFQIQAGTLTYDTAGQVHEVSEIFIHPLYNSYSLENDIALLKLSTPLNFTDAVQPVCLPPPGDYLPEVGSYITFTGWGSFGERGGPSPRNLQKARAPVIPNNICQRPLTNILRVFPSMFCTMYDTGYQSACTGDSGGPLVQEVNGRWTIYGITSWGLTCGEAYSPSGKTRVSSFIDFIYKTIRES
ncbi:transmembrane protease serine 3 [Strongylocentrotus purpuratus]|uniref:Peptidase S1 domain-containing protein n=1 Tax=Strongylocentrotus purpuratus TaxID=7668 RepID=A0A7M7NRS1_STRPU|nr:transmembrane protease serine 3 [Strongylocentrotus purpuratus]